MDVEQAVEQRLFQRKYPIRIAPLRDAHQQTISLDVRNEVVDDLLRERFTRKSDRRQRWMDDIQMTRDLFKQDCRNVQRHMNTLQDQVRSLLALGTGDIAALRLLELCLPMLATVQRIELDYAKVNCPRVFPSGDLRNYTGNLTRVK